ncbi:hypothetical protein Tco_0075843, partial [Tanacetum coccineum]
MSVENVSSGLVPQGQKTSDYDNSGPVPPRQNVVPSAENNNDQAPNASFHQDDFFNPFCTRVQEIDVDLSGEPIDQSDYSSKIGSLMYLTSSRPDLVQAVCYCARYQARPTQKQYPLGLWYPKDFGFELTAFSDADHAGCIDTRKSTSGGIQFFGDKL